jgi:hypothetical protein
MTDLFEIIDNLEQIRDMFDNGELTRADIDYFVRKYQSRLEKFESTMEVDLFDNLPV